MIKEASNWVKFCIKNIANKNKEKIALDLACGLGRNSIYLSSMGYKVISVDLNILHLLSFSQYNIFKIQSDIEISERWPFKQNSFDLVVVTNFLNRSIFKNIQNVIKKKMVILFMKPLGKEMKSLVGQKIKVIY